MMWVGEGDASGNAFAREVKFNKELKLMEKTELTMRNGLRKRKEPV